MISKPQWYQVYLPIDEAEQLKQYLRGKEILFEPSQAFELVCFSCLMTPEQCCEVNDWLKKEGIAK